MTKLLARSVLIGALVLMGSKVTAATQIAFWNFETNTPADLADSATISGIAANVGEGSASGVHASAATDWTTPAGNGSANALSSNTWAVGDYFQFSVTGTGYDSFTISWDQTGSNTGPAQFTLLFSTNGTSFTSVGDYNVVNASWNATTESIVTTDDFSFEVDPVGVSYSGTIFFRMAVRSTVSIGGATVASGGTGRIDNIEILGATAVPEPSAFAALVGVGALGFCAFRRRRPV